MRVHVGHAVDAIILDPYGNVVLVTRRYNPGAGLKATPGGFIDPVKGRDGKSAVENAIVTALREATEETGISRRLLENAKIVRLGHRSYNRPFDIRVTWADMPGTEVKKGDFLAVSTQGFLVETQENLNRIPLKAGDDAKGVHVSNVTELVPSQFGIADHLSMITAGQDVSGIKGAERRGSPRTPVATSD